MKKQVFTLIMAVLVSFSVFAETPANKNGNKLSRQEKRELREKEAIQNATRMKEILESRAWVLEAHQLRDRYGNTAIVNSGINFVGVTGENATIQFGSNHEIGENGVGGLTLDGKINKYEIKEGKKASSGFYVDLSVMGAAMGHSSIYFQISPSGNTSATITTLDGSRLTYDGVLVPLNESKVFKVMTSF